MAKKDKDKKKKAATAKAGPAKGGKTGRVGRAMPSARKALEKKVARAEKRSPKTKRSKGGGR